MKTIKEWTKQHLVASWAIASSVFAVLIHILYAIPAPCNFLENKWEAGDILTYVSTVALGLLAVWQNQKFKEENDKAQELMDKQNREAQDRLMTINAKANELSMNANELALRANELSIISKIAEIDEGYLNNLDKALEEYLSVTNAEMLINLVRTTSKQKAVDYSSSHTQISNAYNALLSAFGSGYHLRQGQSNELLDSVCQYTKDVFEFLQPKEYFSLGFPTNLFTSRSNDLISGHDELTSLSSEYIQIRRKILYAILFENWSLEKIRSLYDLTIEGDA